MQSSLRDQFSDVERLVNRSAMSSASVRVGEGRVSHKGSRYWVDMFVKVAKLSPTG